MITVALITCPNMLATSLTFPKEMLQAAAQIAKLKQRKSSQLRFVTTRISTETASNLGDIGFDIDCEIEELSRADLVIFPALWRSPEPAIKLCATYKQRFQTMAKQGTLFAATGTGTWLMAELELLNNSAATTHWFYLKRFSERYPNLDVRDQHLVTQSANVYCASSINSLADLTVYLIAKLYNETTAKLVQQQFSPEAREHFRERIFIEGDNNAHNDELIADAQQWLRDRHDQDIEIKALAAYLRISQRTLNRRFFAATGITPQIYLQNYRLRCAKELLKETNLSIADVADSVGFGSASYMSRTFQKLEGCSPTTFRKSVKSKLFT